MCSCQLDSYESCGVTLLGDTRCPCGVTFAFTERTGGVSHAPYASLNLSDRMGDDVQAVAANRVRVLDALGASERADWLLVPTQTHDSRICILNSTDPAELERARDFARESSDAVVCTVRDFPVMLLGADCALIVLVAPGGFAIAHCGWKGTLAHLVKTTAQTLCETVRCTPAELSAYIGPHIRGWDYEVSPKLLDRFVAEFGDVVRVQGKECHLSLAAALKADLYSVGLAPEAIGDCELSTLSNPERFFSHRHDGARTGRHGAIAWMASERGDNVA